MVIWLGAWRVNGNLSVSRAIGDAKDKKFITAEADTVRKCHFLHINFSLTHFLSQKSVELDGTEDFLVVACDGVWDVLNAEEMSQEVTKHFTSGGDKNTLAGALIKAARREGSGDNMTVIILYFPTFQLPAAEPEAPTQQQNEAVTKEPQEETGKPEEGPN